MSDLTFKKAAKGDGYLIRTAGWLSNFAMVGLGPTRCGHIEDGISLSLADAEEPNPTQWHPGGVISFADLEAIYLAAKALRAEGKEAKHG